MRYNGYVVSYSGGPLKINKENYFLNGVYREDLEQSDVCDINKDFARRNIYAISSGVKCDEDGDELSSISVELMRNYSTSDFAKEYQTYFSMLNSAIKGQTLKKTGEHFEVDTSVLYIESDVASVYNIGDMPVYYFNKGKMEKLTGDPPKTIEIEKNIYENKWKIYTQVIEKTNIPYLGFPGNEYETVPYVSPQIKLRGNAFFVMCSKSVIDVLDEEILKKILADKQINKKKKAEQIVNMAIEKNPEGNYTVQVICVKRGIPLAHSDVKSLGSWMVLALLCLPLYLAGPYITNAVNGIVDTTKAFVEKYITKDDEPSNDLIWIPKEKDEEKPEEEQPEEAEEKSEQNNVTLSTNPLVTNSPTKPRSPITIPQNPLVQKPVEEEVQQQNVEPPVQPEQVVELPGTTAPVETNKEVELPIDFN